MKNKAITIIILSILFVLDLILVITSNITFFDDFIYKVVISLKSDIFTNIFKLITFFGSVKFIVISCIFIIIYEILKKDLKLVLVPIACTCSFIVNNLIKFIIKRNRPTDIGLVSETFYSFPSGHGMISILFYGTIIYLINVNEFKYRRLITILLSVFILFIGISRIYLGVHFASDIIGAYLLAGIILITLSMLRDKYYKER